MTTLDKRILILLFTLSLCGCTQLDIPNEDLELTSDQTEQTVSGEGIMGPQTLEPSPSIGIEQKSEPEKIDPLTKPIPPTTQLPTVQPMTNLQTGSADSHPLTSPSTSVKESVFGEFPGVSSQWEERKKQLTIQIEEQSKKINELRVQLQLINQVTELVTFVTKASVDNHYDFLMAFTIENRTAFAIKDISITCDQVAPTGTVITSHVETLYDIIKPSTRSTYAPIPYGKKHRQTQILQCQITNFTVEKASADVSGE